MTPATGARTIGALPLGDLCARIEAAGGGGGMHALGALLPSFQRELHSVLSLLAARRAEPYPDPAHNP